MVDFTIPDPVLECAMPPEVLFRDGERIGLIRTNGGWWVAIQFTEDIERQMQKFQTGVSNGFRDGVFVVNPNGEMLRLKNPNDWVRYFGRAGHVISMSRQSRERLDYWRKPLLRHLSNDELVRRFSDCFNLATCFDGMSGKITFVEVLDNMSDKFSVEWLMFGEVMEEFTYRTGKFFPNNRDDVKTIISSELFENGRKLDMYHHLTDRLVECLKGISERDRENVIIKFGKVCHSKDLHKSGVLRVSHASYYDGLKEDLARGDYEREIYLHWPGMMEIKTLRCDDYYLYCTTQCPVNLENSRIAARLFHDFKANACVVIRDKDRFFKSLSEASGFDGFDVKYGKVGYIDPVGSTGRGRNVDVSVRDEVSPGDVPMSKHFRYMYQRECRVVWIPNGSVRRLDHVNVNIGSIEDYATLITPE